MQDMLRDLHFFSGKPDEIELRERHESHISASEGEAEVAIQIDDHEVSPEQVIEQYQEIKLDLVEFRGDIHKWGKISTHMVNSVDTKVEEAELRKLKTDTDHLYTKIVQRLDRYKKLNVQPTGSAPHRMHTNFVRQLLLDFAEIVKTFEDVQHEHKLELRKMTKRQLQATHHNVTDAEVDYYVENPQEQIFQDSMLDKERHVVARNRLADIQERHVEVVQMAKNIQELNRIFKDMAMMVEDQSSLIYSIEHNVQQAVDYTAKGEEQMRQAVISQTNSRKRACCILLIVLVVLVVLVAIFVPSFMAGFKGA